MSNVDKGYGIIKSIMLIGERFDGIDKRIAAISTDVDDLARSHARLSERVADIEGYLRAATGTPFGDKPRLGSK